MATDTFDRARSISVAVLIAAGAAVIVGTLLDWVTIEPPAIFPAELEPATKPFTGLDTKSAPYLVIAAGIMILMALSLAVRRRSLYAWGAFLAAIVVGAIAFQNYRGLEELFYDQMERIGEPSPGLGLTLVAAGGVIGVIAGAAAIAAVPPRDADDHTD